MSWTIKRLKRILIMVYEIMTQENWRNSLFTTNNQCFGHSSYEPMNHWQGPCIRWLTCLLIIRVAQPGNSQMTCFESNKIRNKECIKNWMGPYQRWPLSQLLGAVRYSGLGVRSVGPVGDFLEREFTSAQKKTTTPQCLFGYMTLFGET